MATTAVERQLSYTRSVLNTLSLSKQTLISEGISATNTPFSFDAHLETRLQSVFIPKWISYPILIGVVMFQLFRSVMATDLLQNSPLRNATLEQNDLGTTSLLPMRTNSVIDQCMLHHWGSGISFRK